MGANDRREYKVHSVHMVGVHYQCDATYCLSVVGLSFYLCSDVWNLRVNPETTILKSKTTCWRCMVFFSMELDPLKSKLYLRLNNV